MQTTLRLRPDRIVVGEVRDGAALEVLKAWNTGHPGGLLTLHANSAVDALARLEDLAMEAAHLPPRRLIASAVDIIVFIARSERGRRITEIAEVMASRAMPIASEVWRETDVGDRIRKPALRCAAALAIALLATTLATPAYARGLRHAVGAAAAAGASTCITGPVARAAAVIAIVIAGIGIMFSEGGGGHPQARLRRPGHRDHVRGGVVLPAILRLRRRGGAVSALKELASPKAIACRCALA